MTVTNVDTTGTRQLAVLATVSAMVAMAALLFGAAIAGIASENSGLVILSLGAIFLAVTLWSGWVPGLYLGILMVAIGSIFVGDELRFPRAVILAVTIVVVHETARFSLDARKPTRLGAGLLLRTALGGGLAIVVVVATALAIRAITETAPALVWVPLGLIAVAGPLYAARFAELLVSRIDLSPAVSVVIGGVVAAAIVIVVALGAQNREDVTDSLSEGTAVVESENAEPQPPTFDTEALDGSLAMLIGMFVAAGVLGLLYGAYYKQQILLEQDDIELDLDDSRFSLSLPDPAEVEDVGLDIDATQALLDDLVRELDDEPDPGRAIRYAYANIEQQLAALGIERTDSETAHEFMNRALPVLGEGASLNSLTTLFERARFSDKAVPESMRTDARQALEDLRRQIAAAPRPVAEDDEEAGAR